VIQKLFLISIIVIVFFILEFFLFNILGSWFLPNLLLLVIIFFNLYLGIRYSLFAGLLSGLLRDSFSTAVFGINIFALIICAYMTTILSQHVYHKGSRSSRLLLVFLVCIIHSGVQVILYMMFGSINFLMALKFAILPEILGTLIVATTVFHWLKKCVLRFCV